MTLSVITLLKIGQVKLVGHARGHNFTLGLNDANIYYTSFPYPVVPSQGNAADRFKEILTYPDLLVIYM